jgi:TetR/AcrR family transcriptional regulator, transcriptional repressor for nem operon
MARKRQGAAAASGNTAGRAPDKRQRLVETAAKLSYAQGFKSTSLADIARESGVPLGNVYFYFKTKDSIGDALVDGLAERFAAALANWDTLPDPRRRLEAFVQMTVDDRDALARSGCPIGTLCAELHKDGGPLAERAATIFASALDWLAAQFRQLGKGRESRDLAVHVLSALEGASLLTHTFHDPSYATREAERLKRWLRTV